jgi:hypothetical protein
VDFGPLSLLVEKKDGISLTNRGRRVISEVQIRPVYVSIIDQITASTLYPVKMLVYCDHC